VSRIVEIIATVAILLAVAWGGRLLLLSLQRHSAFSAAVIALGIVVAVVAIRRDYRGGSGERVRIAVTRDAAYLTALLLVFWSIVVPARWIDGSSIAMTEVAIAFDAFTRVVTRQAP
jgi:hypothetical protein